MTTTQEPDPFGAAPPLSETVTDGASGPRAGFWRRFGAYLLDSIVILVIVIPFLLIDPLLANIVSIVGGVAYFTILEGGAKGQTLGKMALGIRVIDLASGRPIGPGRAFIRYIGRIASAIVILLGYFWMLWDKEKQTWHDKMAGSVIVPVSSYPVN